MAPAYMEISEINSSIEGDLRDRLEYRWRSLRLNLILMEIAKIDSIFNVDL